jgi:hypothetical protein
MEKTAKIVRTVFKNVWNNPKGGQVFYHDIELDNGDKGSIGSKEQMPVKLNPGSDLTYTIDAGKIKASLPPQQGAGQWPKGGGKPVVDPKVQMISFALSYTKDLVVAGKIGMADLEKEFTRIYNLMTSKL